jgi:hypothetical protein
VADVIRPVRLAAIALVAAAATGCATFTDDNIVARVGDAELTSDQLVALMTEVPDQSGVSGTQVEDRAPAELARFAISNWITLRGLDASGVLDRVHEGLTSINMACLKVMQPSDSLQAQAILDRLEGGEDWDAVLAAEVPEAVDRDRVQCLDVSTLPPSLAESLGGLSSTSPYRIVEDGGQSIVISVQADDELMGQEMLQALQTIEPDTVAKIFIDLQDADVYVDPRYGSFDARRLSVVPLG